MTEMAQAGRASNIALMGLVVVASVGFFAGTRSAPEFDGYTEAPPLQNEDVVRRAVPNALMEQARYQDLTTEHARALAGFGPESELLEPRDQATVLDRENSVATRSEHRAYDGAPPMIPHTVDTHGVPACLSCHEHGARIEDRIAPVMSHEVYASCTQCHAMENGLPFDQGLPNSVSNDNSFVGTASAGNGERAWPAAPPTMPHRSFMRERCVSCHGIYATGLASSHPHRQSCTQCHAPSAELDQRVLPEPEPMRGLDL